MIIFDLDNTVANCEHRRHFIDLELEIKRSDTRFEKVVGTNIYMETLPNGDWKKWKPDWDAFYEACDRDEPIKQVVKIYENLVRDNYGFPLPHIEIWSGRSESVRNKTEKWIKTHILSDPYFTLKMRPIGDYTADDVLKERWLDEVLAQGKTIDFVFDDRPKVVRMWRRRGIFVFNCNQSDEEF